MLSKKFYDKKVVFIGSGNMAEAIVSGFVKYDMVKSSNIFCNDILQERLNYMAKKYTVSISHDKEKALEKADIVFLAIKPQQIEAIIKGDAKAMCIAAASIMAKVTRDHICYELDKKYPQYQIAKHKGYGTKLHMELLEKYGPNKDIYRMTYAPVKKFFIEKVSLF